MVEDKTNLINRLNRIEGQIRGIKGMVEEDKHRLDILHQIWAVHAALNKTGEILLENYTHGLYDTQRSKREVGYHALHDKLLMRQWPYPRRGQSGVCLAYTEKRGEASRQAAKNKIKVDK